MMKKFISLILIANFIAVPFFTLGQDLKTFTKGSEKPIKIKSRLSTTITGLTRLKNQTRSHRKRFKGGIISRG